MNRPGLPKATIDRAREWADRAPKLDAGEAIERAARLSHAAPSRGAGARGWLLAGAAAAALVSALVVRQPAPPVERPWTLPVPSATEPTGSSTVVIELSSGTRLYVALRRT